MKELRAVQIPKRASGLCRRTTLTRSVDENRTLFEADLTGLTNAMTRIVCLTASGTRSLSACVDRDLQTVLGVEEWHMFRYWHSGDLLPLHLEEWSRDRITGPIYEVLFLEQINRALNEDL